MSRFVTASARLTVQPRRDVTRFVRPLAAFGLQTRLAFEQERGPDGKFLPGPHEEKETQPRQKADRPEPIPAHEYAQVSAGVDAKLDAALDTIGDTKSLHTDADGKYSPERDEMHEKILTGLMEKYSNVPSDNKAIVMAGVPAAGKSTLIKTDGSSFGVEADKDGNPKNYATVNPDDMKELLLEHNALGSNYAESGLTAGESAGLLHEESSDLAKDLLDRLTSQGKNVLIDGTLAGSAEKQVGKVTDLRAKGYAVKGVLINGSVDNSLKNAQARHYGSDAKFSGRYVKTELIDKLRVEPGQHSALLGKDHQNVASKNFEAIAPSLNNGYHVYDNEGGTHLVSVGQPFA